MTLDELDKLIRVREETDQVEFKATTGELHAACRTLCAFLNNSGGVTVIGARKKENGEYKYVGQMVTDNTRLEVANELSKFEPPVRVRVDYVPLTDGKQIICFQVAQGSHMPYVYDGRPYERVESSTRKMSQSRYNQLLCRQNQLNHSWERFDAEKYTIDGLDHNLILSIIRKSVEKERLAEIAMREDIPTVLEKLELIENGRIKNATVALFGEKFLPNYPQCHLKIARFKGLDRHEFLDNEFIYGNIFELIEKAMLFVRRHLPLAAKIVPGKLERVETPLIPFDVIREAVINAFCHREYSVYGGSVKLAIYDDRMEVINDGGLLPGVTLEKIKSGYSKLRNPLIADILFRSDYIEGWGRGIKEIYGELKKAGDPEPEFDCDEYDFKVTFKFPTSMKPAVILKDETANLSERQRAIVKIISQVGEIRASDIISKLGPSPSEKTLSRDLAALKKLGVIDVRGHAWTAVWFLKDSK